MICIAIAIFTPPDVLMTDARRRFWQNLLAVTKPLRCRNAVM